MNKAGRSYMPDSRRKYEITTGASYFYMPGEKVCIYSDVEIDSDVDEEVLRRACSLLLKRFPYIAVKAEAGEDGDRYILVENVNPFPLLRKNGSIHIGTPEANEYLFTVSFSGKHIFTEVFHGLCDGMGYVTVIKALIKAYFEELDGCRYECGGIKNVWDAPDEADSVDPFSKKISMDHPFTYKKRPSYSFSDDQIDEDNVRLYSFSVPEKKLVDYARKYEGGVSGAISLALARAVDVLAPDNELPINIACPNNIRGMLGCMDTLYNCTKSATYTHSTRLRELSYDQQLSVLKGQMMIQCSPEYQIPRFQQDAEELAQLNALDTIQAKKDSFKEMKLKTIPIVSYLGKFDMDELNERIENIRINCKVMGKAGMQNMCLCFKDRCYIYSSCNLRSENYIKMFANEMKDFSYDCSEIKCLDF